MVEHLGRHWAFCAKDHVRRMPLRYGENYLSVKLLLNFSKRHRPAVFGRFGGTHLLTEKLEAHVGKHHEGNMTSDGLQTSMLAGSQAARLLECAEADFDGPAAAISPDHLVGGPVLGVREQIDVRVGCLLLMYHLANCHCHFSNNSSYFRAFRSSRPIYCSLYQRTNVHSRNLKIQFSQLSISSRSASISA